MRSEIVNIIKETVDEMSGFSRVRNMMQGGVASVDSIGILTAENPYGQEATTQDNSIKMRQLKSQINSMGLGFIKIGGSYEMKEIACLSQTSAKSKLLRWVLSMNKSLLFLERKKNHKKDIILNGHIFKEKKQFKIEKSHFQGWEFKIETTSILWLKAESL